MPPELIVERDRGDDCTLRTPVKPTPSMDMWSAGVVLFMLLGGYNPFYTPCKTKRVFQNIVKVSFDFKQPVWETVSDVAKDLISKILVRTDDDDAESTAKALLYVRPSSPYSQEFDSPADSVRAPYVCVEIPTVRVAFGSTRRAARTVRAGVEIRNESRRTAEFGGNEALLCTREPSGGERRLAPRNSP
eukprot:8995018-Pyramimonas_sp.AAC.1